MIKKTLNAIVLIIVGILFFSGKPRHHRYFLLKWDNDSIADFLNTPNLSFVVFNFDKNIWGKRTLGVSGFDNADKLVATSTLFKYDNNRKNKSKFSNAYPGGLFFIKIDDLKKYSSNGTKSLYFKPVLFQNVYVGYDISEDPEFHRLVVTPLNPSPPRNPYN